MLFSTSLVALILSPRRLIISNTKVYHWNAGFWRVCSDITQRQSTICELTFPTTVLAVRMNRKRLVVVLEDQIYLYDISNMKLLYTIETSPNPNGILLHDHVVKRQVLIYTSYMCSVTVFGKLLPILSSSSKGDAFVLRPSIPCSSRLYTYRSYQRRCFTL